MLHLTRPNGQILSIKETDIQSYAPMTDGCEIRLVSGAEWKVVNKLAVDVTLNLTGIITRYKSIHYLLKGRRH